MKLLATIFISLFSLSSFSLPSVGDFAQFEVRTEQNGAYLLAYYKVEITSKTEDGKFVIKTTVSMEDQAEEFTQEQIVDSEQLMTDAQIAEAIDKCVSLGGEKRILELVGQQIDSCMISNKNDKGEVIGENYIAKVPFGIALQKEFIPDIERVTTIALKSFQFGSNK